MSELTSALVLLGAAGVSGLFVLRYQHGRARGVARDFAREIEARARVAMVRWVTLSLFGAIATVTGGAVALKYGPNLVANAVTQGIGHGVPSWAVTTDPPATPSITLVPFDEAVTVILGAFSGDGSDTHASTDYQVTRLIDTAFAAPVLSVVASDSLERYTLLGLGTDSIKTDSAYWARARQTGDEGGPSAWAVDEFVANESVLAGACIPYNGSFFEFDPSDLANRAAMIAADADGCSTSCDSLTLQTGMTLYDGSVGKTVRYWHPGDGSTTYADYNVSITGASPSATDTIWIEQYMRWDTLWIDGGGDESKSFFVSAPNHPGQRFGDYFNWSPNNAYSQAGSLLTPALRWGPYTTDEIYGHPGSRNEILFGGVGSDGGTKWRRIRREYAAESTTTSNDGIFLLKFDSVQITFPDADPPGDSVAGWGLDFGVNNDDGYFNDLRMLGSNQSVNVTSTTAWIWKETGAICVYTVDPGWPWTHGADGLLSN